jgi:translation elongation factor EF-4
MTLVASSFLDALKAGADHAEFAEGQYRQEAAIRIATLERERAFAFRRLNFMRAVAEAVASSESEEMAVASAEAVVRGKLGWTVDTEARTEVLSRFAPVAQALFRSLAPSDDASFASIRNALADFESWYAGGHQAPFWVLFEHYIAETPRVDF